MNDAAMPPLPGAGEYGPQVCATIRLYLAVLDDLAPKQVDRLYQHVHSCPACAEELQLLQRTTHLVASGLASSAPSPRAERAILAALNSQNDVGAKASRAERVSIPAHPAPVSILRPARLAPFNRRVPRRRPAWLVGSLVAAAVVVLAFLSTMHFIGIASNSPGPQEFSLPASLSWSGHVLYHSETDIGSLGVRYDVETYHDLATGRMHVETTVPGQLDVVAVKDGHTATVLGMDMMHHVAQNGANAWMVDDSAFNLAQLRHDLSTKNAVEWDKGTFKSQQVYRIHLQSGLVLLLDMHYMPVNVLRGAVAGNPDTGVPMYDTLMWLSPTQVSPSMWAMGIPPGFHMGTLPPRP